MLKNITIETAENHLGNQGPDFQKFLRYDTIRYHGVSINFTPWRYGEEESVWSGHCNLQRGLCN